MFDSKRNLIIAFFGLVALANSQTTDAWWFEQAQGKSAVAMFDLADVKGTIKFSQNSENEPTRVEYDLIGLKGNNKLYHVHVRPVPAYELEKVRSNATAIQQLCSDSSTGGHLNPHHAPSQQEKFELGDLSGKHGPMEQVGPKEDDHYAGNYIDDKLPMFGEHSIIGKSIVIHKNDKSRWICANILESGKE